jgi:putative ABC transport system permease protein
VLALLPAVVGVYGLKSYIVSQRAREIGIPMAVGASHRDVLALVMRDGLFLTGTGVAVRLLLAASCRSPSGRCSWRLAGSAPL